jgi:hypothetical protein
MADSFLHTLESEQMSLEDIINIIKKNPLSDIDKLPLPDSIRKQLNLAPATYVDIYTGINKVFSTKEYVSVETRETPKDFQFPEVPPSEHLLLCAE